MDTLEAKLSNAAYDPAQHPEIDGYQLDSSLSNKNASTYYHPQTKRAIIAYRGTNPLNADDLKADLDIAFGQRKHRRFQEAVDLANKVKQKYQDVSVTGHSLGGTQALHVHDQLGLNAKVFNPGSRLFGQEKAVDPNKVQIYRHRNDLVSAGHANNNTIDLNPIQSNPLFDTVRNIFKGPTGAVLDQLRDHSISSPDSTLKGMFNKIFGR